jgi:flagellar basal body-associated protein FliL
MPGNDSNGPLFIIIIIMVVVAVVTMWTLSPFRFPSEQVDASTIVSGTN